MHHKCIEAKIGRAALTLQVNLHSLGKDYFDANLPLHNQPFDHMRKMRFAAQPILHSNFQLQ